MTTAAAPPHPWPDGSDYLVNQPTKAQDELTAFGDSGVPPSIATSLGGGGGGGGANGMGNDGRSELPCGMQPTDVTELITNVLETMGRSSRPGRVAPLSHVVLLEKARRIDLGKLDEHLKELDQTPLFGIAKRKLWNSVCPATMDVLLKRGPLLQRPTSYFSEHIINKRWLPQLREAMWSIMAVGYFAVTYSKSPDCGDILLPTVLQPQDYILWWTVDQHGTKHPQISPRGLPVSPLNNVGAFDQKPAAGQLPVSSESFTASAPTDRKRYGIDIASSVRLGPLADSVGYWQIPNAQFEAADVFVESWPSDSGEIRSRSRECLREITYLNQIILDMTLLNNARSNVPMVTQFVNPDGFAARIGYGTGDGRIPAATFASAAPYSGRPTASGPIGVPPPITPERAEEALGVQLFEYGARSGAANSLNRKLAKAAVDEASSSSRFPPLRIFDPDKGSIVKGVAPHSWRNAHIQLPPGCTLGAWQPPDISKVLVDQRDYLTSIISNSLECPPELILGSSSRNATATTTLEQERIRSSIRYWRTLICNYAETLYWRIFGDVTVLPVFALAARSGIVITPERAHATILDISVQFSFRAEQMASSMAVELYERGLINRGYVQQVFMSTYGLPESAFQNLSELDAGQSTVGGGGGGGSAATDTHTPASGRRREQAESSKEEDSEPESRPRTKKQKRVHDSNTSEAGFLDTEDISAIGFADGKRRSEPRLKLDDKL